MRINTSTRFATLAALVGALACAGNSAKVDETGAAKDTTNTNTAAGRDTTQNPTPTAQTPSDTFLQNQGTGTPQDTAGYSGIERDTTHQVNPQAPTDTTGAVSPAQTDTTGAGGVTDTSSSRGAVDTSGYNQSSGTASPSSSTTGLDSSGTSKTGDTTGYSPSQQQQDSTSR